MEREKLFDKIRALRSLSKNKSASIEEAATAARIIENIIQQNNIQEAELEISTGIKEEAYRDGVPIVQFGKRQTIWQNILLTHLCEAYGCEGVLTSMDGKVGFYAIGRPSNISNMRFQFAFFHLELTRLAKMLSPDDLERGSGKQWYNSFYLGAVRSIGETLRASKQEVRMEASSTALAILDNHAQEAKALLRKLHPNAQMKEHKSNLNHDAYEIGKAVGSNLNKSPELSSGVRGLLNK